MSKSDPSASKKERNKTIQWVVTIFIITILISALIAFVSDELMDVSPIWVAFLILLVIVILGIVFDIVGVAVTSADEKPFHSMAARKVPGAHEAIALLRSAEKVSSICNDVIGDICGVVSGTAAATISASVLMNMENSVTMADVVPLVMSALVAGITVGGKALGKKFAINSCTGIVSLTGRVIYFLKHIPDLFKRKKSNS